MHNKIYERDVKWFLFWTMFFVVLSIGGEIKYLFCAMLILLLSKIFDHIDLKLFYIAIPLFVFLALGVFLTKENLLQTKVVKEILFYVFPPVTAIVLFDYLPETVVSKTMNMIFWGVSIVFLVQGVRRFSAENLMESQYAFVFGLYVILFLYKKQKINLLFSILMLYLAHKRIVFGAVFCAIVVWIILDIIRKRWVETAERKLSVSMFLLLTGLSVISVLLAYVYMCRNGVIENIFTRLGINPQGRLNIWKMFYDRYSFSPLYVGKGIGSVVTYLQSANIAAFDRLHNDILMQYIELGFIGFCTYWLSYFYMIHKLLYKRYIDSANAIYIISIIIYTLACCSTDNICIYINYMFVFYMAILCEANIKKTIGKDDIRENRNISNKYRKFWKKRIL